MNERANVDRWLILVAVVTLATACDSGGTSALGDDADAASMDGSSDADSSTDPDACAAGGCVDGLREITTNGAPEGDRYFHVSAWTGDAMFVWGGKDYFDDDYLTTGGLYDPVADTWSPISEIGAPPGRESTRAVWTGTEVLIWGGRADTTFDLADAAYDPATDTWRPITETGAPPARSDHSVAWTGSEMIVWGGTDGMDTLGDGAAYDPATDTWRALPDDAASYRRAGQTAGWVDGALHVFGGIGDDDGAGLADVVFAGHRVLDGDSWRDGQSSGAPSPRYLHSATPIGAASDQWFVWGGFTEAGAASDGGVWDAVTDAWSALPTQDAPSARRQASTLWVEGAGAVVVLGGIDAGMLLEDGAVWTPSTGTWTPLPAGLPASTDGSAVSTGDQVIVWGLDGGAVITP